MNGRKGVVCPPERGCGEMYQGNYEFRPGDGPLYSVCAHGADLSDSEGESSEMMLEDRRQATYITMIVEVATV